MVSWPLRSRGYPRVPGQSLHHGLRQRRHVRIGRQRNLQGFGDVLAARLDHFLGCAIANAGSWSIAASMRVSSWCIHVLDSTAAVLRIACRERRKTGSKGSTL